MKTGRLRVFSISLPVVKTVNLVRWGRNLCPRKAGSKAARRLAAIVAAVWILLSGSPAAAATCYWTTTPGTMSAGDGTWDVASPTTYWATDALGNGGYLDHTGNPVADNRMDPASLPPSYRHAWNGVLFPIAISGRPIFATGRPTL